MIPLFKLGTFSLAGSASFPGLVINDRVIALEALQSLHSNAGLQLARCATILDVLDDWEHNVEALAKVAIALSDTQCELQRQLRPVGQLHVHAPVPQPRGIY